MPNGQVGGGGWTVSSKPKLSIAIVKNRGGNRLFGFVFSAIVCIGSHQKLLANCCKLPINLHVERLDNITADEDQRRLYSLKAGQLREMGAPHHKPHDITHFLGGETNLDKV